MPYFLATSAVASWLPPTREVTSTPGMRLSASRCFCPKAPWPATQIFICLASSDVLLDAMGGRTPAGGGLALGRCSALGACALGTRALRAGARPVIQDDVPDRGV